MAVVWIILEFVMLFFYYDLPMVKPDEEKEDQIGFEHSVNSSVEDNSPDKKLLYGNTTSKVERSSGYIISSDMNGDLTSSDAISDGEKQKLIDLNAPGSPKRSRTTSVTANWHLAKGILGWIILY